MRDLVRGRITGRLDLDRLLNESGLSGPAASTVHNVVKRTRLWRLEKVDVAHELIAHFLDGLEAETPLDERLNAFGDERQAAKLIRRAMKRQRPAVWHALKWSWRAVAGLFVVYLGMFIYFMMGSPDIKVDYLAQFNARANAVPENERAWPLYRQAYVELDLRRVREWDTPTPYYADLPPEEQEEYWEELEPPFRANVYDRLRLSLHPDDPGWESTASFLREHTEQFALIRQGAQQSGMGMAAGFPEDYAPEDRVLFQIEVIQGGKNRPFTHPEKNLFSALLPHLGPVRQMTHLLAADTRLAAIQGDAPRAYNDLVALQGLADHCLETPCVIGELVSLSIRTIGYEVTTEILTRHPDQLTDDQLRRLAHHYASSDLSLEYCTNGERQWFYDLAQRIYTDDGHGDGRLTPEGIKLLRSVVGSISVGSYLEQEYLSIPQLEDVLGPTTMLTMASRKELTDKYEQMLDAHAEEANKPLWEGPQLQDIDEQIESWSRLEQRKFIILNVLMPSMGYVMQKGETVRGKCDGILIGIALELYHRDTGDWPRYLDVLSPQYIPRLPVDRLTGKPLKYRITDDGPLVYSVGVDGDDDGGQAPINPNTGEAANREASASRYYGQHRTEPKHDGDWVLWPEPRD